MKQFASILLTLMFLVGACASCSGSATYPEAVFSKPSDGTIDRTLQSTVVLFDYNQYFHCSGVAISPTEILTAFHCVDAAVLSDEQVAILDTIDPERKLLTNDDYVGKTVRFTLYEQITANKGEDGTERLYSTVKAVDKRSDLAILKTLLPLSSYVLVATTEPAVGSFVFAVGHPQGMFYSYSAGVVSASCREMQEPSNHTDACYIQTDLKVYGGSSGGGLYNERGELVGIASFMLRGSYFAFFASNREIHKLLKPQAS